MENGTKKSESQNMAHHLQQNLLAKKVSSTYLRLWFLENQNSALI